MKTSVTLDKVWLPAGFACLVAALTGALIFLSSRSTGTQFVYPLDDTYIMMAIAKNFAHSAVWGVTPFSFSPASSTPLYTLLLSGFYWITGPNTWLPAALATTCACLTVVEANTSMAELPRMLRAAGLLSIVLLVPLYVIALTGMEHCLHIYLSLLFLRLASTSIESGRPARLLVLLVPVMVLVRYESLFPIGICSGILILRKRWLFGLTLLLAAGAALATYAAFSIAHGCGWLPNSILMKGTQSSPGTGGLLQSMLVRLIVNLIAAPYCTALLVLLLLGLLATRGAAPIWDRRRIALAIVSLAILAHFTFARVGWVYRYEAYLIALSLVCLACVTPLLRFTAAMRLAFGTCAAAALLSLAFRSYGSTANIQKASFNIYEQQYQMSKFVSRYYPHAAIAANDIGWITYANDVHLVDLVGLADWEVLQAKQKHEYTTSFIDSLASRRQVDIAIVYDSWFNDGQHSEFGGPALPRTWLQAARWHIEDNHFLGGDTVSFYAVKPDGIGALQSALQDYKASLPRSVQVLEK
jgi:hypothetical protein